MHSHCNFEKMICHHLLDLFHSSQNVAVFYGMIAIISANIIFRQPKYGRKYFREYPHNGEDDLEALFYHPALTCS
jgi:hypothetical protein